MDREEALKAVSRIFDWFTPEIQEAVAVLAPELQETEDTYVELFRNFVHDFANNAGGKVTIGNAVGRDSIRNMLRKYADFVRRQDLRQKRADAHNTMEQRSDVGTAGNYRHEASAKD